MSEALDKQAQLSRLNEKLREHPDFEEGMAFVDVDSRGYHLLDPRHLHLQRAERAHDFSDAPFAATIESIKREAS